MKLSRGSFVQRLPGVKHSTVVKPDGKWLEFFICISAESYHNLLSMGLMSDQPVMNCDGAVVEELLPTARTLRKQFRISTGISIGQYAIRVRVNRAKTLLLRSNLSVEKLAIQLGYPDCFSFCKQFKQHTGVSPSQFRQMN